MKRAPLLLFVLVAALALTGAACKSDADKASENLSKLAEQFKVARKFVVVNGITDTVIWEVTGRCSYESSPRQLVLTCQEDKTKKGLAGYKKHTIGLGDNTIWTQTQLEPINVSVYRTKIIFKPQNVIPDIDLVTGDPDPSAPAATPTATP